MESPELYNHYEKWKNWDQRQFYKVDDDEVRYLKFELGSDDLSGKDVLEIGFGNATKLAWLASQGANVFGTELNDELKSRAVSAGIQVVPTDFQAMSAQYASRFDMIIAYDVFEHLKFDAVHEAIVAICTMLRPNGLLVARFPNGRSPLGRNHQYADHTHRSVLSDSVIQQIIQGLPLHLERKSDGYYLYTPKSLKDVALSVKCVLQKGIGFAVQKIYNIDTPIGPNLIVHIRKDSL
jgi:2-polyprenyl-3-methyl-5-hydroxy-6-metoxy-1,4-benzoquinol methylase